MITKTNRFKGTCVGCNCNVTPGAGILEYRSVYSRGRMVDRIQVFCTPCFDKSDNSSAEDRQCGNRAYEDKCAEACGMG